MNIDNESLRELLKAVRSYASQEAKSECVWIVERWEDTGAFMDYKAECCDYRTTEATPFCPMCGKKVTLS